jgi:hypothetical protein
VPVSLISDAMRSIIGKTMETTVSYPVAASDIRRWAIAVYYPEQPPQVFWDEQWAAGSRFGGVVAPAEFNPFAWGPQARTLAVAPDPNAKDAVGTPELRIGVAPPPFSHILNGGLESRYTNVLIRPGDVITSSSAIVEYKEREGRLGQMLFTAIESRWTNQSYELVSIQRMTLIRY